MQSWLCWRTLLFKFVLCDFFKKTVCSEFIILNDTLFCLTLQDPAAYPQPTTQDLASFWDLLQLNIEDVRVKFQDLQRLKDSGWRLPPEKKVRGSGLGTALVTLRHPPRAKVALCRRVAQMAVPSTALQAVGMQSGKRI